MFSIIHQNFKIDQALYHSHEKSAGINPVNTPHKVVSRQFATLYMVKHLNEHFNHFGKLYYKPIYSVIQSFIITYVICYVVM